VQLVDGCTASVTSQIISSGLLTTHASDAVNNKNARKTDLVYP
ncbi:hypothetical protein THOM_1349, partial [Trachipleistophora hominis]